MSRSAVLLVSFLAVAVAVALGAGCHGSPRSSRRAPAVDGFRPPQLSLPTLVAPRPLPAARVLHLLYTSNVVGDLEPCG
jgi:hypothetical protein